MRHVPIKNGSNQNTGTAILLGIDKLHAQGDHTMNSNGNLSQLKAHLQPTGFSTVF